ncbi:MAG: methyltransferase domain-containing protein [Acidimicrobiia bacterium]
MSGAGSRPSRSRCATSADGPPPDCRFSDSHPPCARTCSGGRETAVQRPWACRHGHARLPRGDPDARRGRPSDERVRRALRIAARMVGSSGSVAGVDLTPEMIELATSAARDVNAINVSFVAGEAEALPFQDASFDVVVGNPVLSLVPEEPRALSEISRVLRPGGRPQSPISCSNGPPRVRSVTSSTAGRAALLGARIRPGSTICSGMRGSSRSSGWQRLMSSTARGARRTPIITERSV